MGMSIENLEGAIQRVGSAVELLRNSTYPAFEFPVQPETKHPETFRSSG